MATDRRRSADWYRTRHSTFFSTASEVEDDGVGIAKDATNSSSRDETWERVEVAEPSEIGHADIVTGFGSGEK